MVTADWVHVLSVLLAGILPGRTRGCGTTPDPVITKIFAQSGFCPPMSRATLILSRSRHLDCQCKTAFVLAHKFRETMGSELKSRKLNVHAASVWDSEKDYQRALGAFAT